MIHRFRLDYRLKLNTGLAIQSGSGGGRFHQTLMRDRDGLMIPASTQKGRLRHFCERVAALVESDLKPDQRRLNEMVAKLFGTIENRQDGAGKRQHLLYFENAYLDEAFAIDQKGHHAAAFMPVESRSRIKINRLTGSVDANHLAFFQTTSRGLVFAAHIEGYLGACKPSQDPGLGLLLAALSMFDRLGSNQSRGCGAVTCDAWRLATHHLEQGQAVYNAQVLEQWRQDFVNRELTKEAAS